MYKYDKAFLEKKSHETGFMRATLEKVYRLTDILEYFNQNPLLKDSLALKGGTAINLTIFNLPRLSVDIDLDYTRNSDRDTMLTERKQINADINKYMTSQGYALNPELKHHIPLIQ